MFKKYIGNKAFYKQVFTIIIPIMLQQLFLSIAGYVDSIMINSYGDTAAAYNGVSAANRLIFILNFFWFGLCCAVNIFTAQFYGAKNPTKVKETIRLSSYITVTFGIIGFIVITLFGNKIVDTFIIDPTARQYGYDYIAAIRYATVFISINYTFATSYRCIEKPKLPLIVGTIGILVNVFFNWCLIFGNLGFEAMGARGAAIATVISKIVESILYILSVILSKNEYTKNIFESFKISKELLIDCAKRGTPVALNELLFSIGMVILARFYTYENDLWYNAYAYTQNINDLFFVVFAGLGNGCGIIIGATLGEGKFEEAQKQYFYFKGLGIVMGFTVGMLLLFTSPLTARMFTQDEDTIKIMCKIMSITGIFTAIYCYNAVNFFTLRAGGDSYRAVALDQAPSYLVGIPITIVLGINAVNWGLTIVEIYLASHALDIVKMVLGDFFIKQKKWLKNLTIENK